jgi:hypothetical protein
MELSRIDESMFSRFIWITSKKSNAHIVALANLICKGGTTVVCGWEEELWIWRLYIAREADGLKLIGSGDILFVPLVSYVDQCCDRIVSSTFIRSSRAKKIYFCCLQFRQEVQNTFSLCKNFDLKVYFKTGKHCNRIKIERYFFVNRVFDSIFEKNLVFECTICSAFVENDIVETICYHRICFSCFLEIKKHCTKCPFCRTLLLPRNMINPKYLTLHEKVEDIMKDKDWNSWIVLCRGSEKIDLNPLKTFTRGVSGRRKTPSRKFSAQYFYHLPGVVGLIFEENWCLEIAKERILKMLSFNGCSMITLILLSPVNSNTYTPL